MAKRKALFIAESLSVGGAEKALVSILSNLDYKELDVTLMLISKSGDFVKELEGIDGLKVRHIVSPSHNAAKQLLNAMIIKAIYKWMPSTLVGNYLCNGYDVAIAFCEGYLTKWVGSSTSKCKKIAWVHTDMVNNDWPLKSGIFDNEDKENKAYLNFDEIVAVSKIVAQGMRDKFKCDNVSVIYNIIDSRIQEKALLPVVTTVKSRLNIVSVGRLEYVKGYDLLIEAMNILVNQQNLDIHLGLIGDGSQRQSLEDLIVKNNLRNAVSLVGMQPNPYPFVEKADLFVCPSRQEGFNIAILEAMMLGKPIIATETAGPLEILDNGCYGVLAAVSAESLASKIKNFYYDSKLISDYAQHSRTRAKYFSAEESMQRIIRLIER